MSAQAPYVVTNDLQLVFNTLEKRGITPPTPSRIEEAGREITRHLGRMFPTVEIIQGEEIESFLKEQTQASSLPVISLTSLLKEPDAFGTLAFSRTLRADGEQNGQLVLRSAGYMPRDPNGPSLEQQMETISKKLKDAEQNQVALADDVVYSGGTLLRYINLLKDKGIEVKKIIASVVASKDVLDRFESLGIEVVSGRKFSNVVDEVCMRDFVIAAPDGGRKIITFTGKTVTGPYVRPCGDPENWASVSPDHAASFSQTCHKSAHHIWEGVKKPDGKPVTFGDVGNLRVLFYRLNDPISRVVNELMSVRHDKSSVICLPSTPAVPTVLAGHTSTPIGGSHRPSNPLAYTPL